MTKVEVYESILIKLLRYSEKDFDRINSIKDFCSKEDFLEAVDDSIEYCNVLRARPYPELLCNLVEKFLKNKFKSANYN